MIRLSAKDSWILAHVAQYEHLPREERQHLLDGAGDEAKQIGLVILGLAEPISPEIGYAADAIRKWARENREHATAQNRRITMTRAAG